MAKQMITLELEDDTVLILETVEKMEMSTKGEFVDKAVEILAVEFADWLLKQMLSEVVIPITNNN